MGKVKLNIVGYNSHYILDGDYITISLRDIYKYLITKNVLLVKLAKCKFIHSGKILELNEDNFKVNDIFNIYIVVDSHDLEFKNELIKKLFNVNLESELEDSIVDSIEEVYVNNELCDYFKDSEFITLLNIVKNKPHYLELVNSYLSHGDIIDEIDFDSIDIENFAYHTELAVLEAEFTLLKPGCAVLEAQSAPQAGSHVGYFDIDKVKKVLTYYDGNVNLTSRYLLI
jgi:hypothetical protein